MVSDMVFPDIVIAPLEILLHTGTGDATLVGVRVIVAVLVAVGVSVRVGVLLGVLVKTGVGVGVLVGVFVGVGVGVGVRVFVAVGVEAVHVEGGTVTWIETLTKTVRALCASIGLLLATERSRKPTILGTIGR
jgi:hypothetical protein